MKIYVRNNDPVKAYRALMKKLTDDGFYKELRKYEFHQSKSQKTKLKHKHALIYWRKHRSKQEEIFNRFENRFSSGPRKKV